MAEAAEAAETTGMAGHEFLWEQISASVEPVELHEVRRVVGEERVQACEDMYAEVRALQDILSEFSAVTDEMLAQSSSQAQLVRASGAGLVALEVKALVSHLLSARPGALSSSADTLLPKIGRAQQRALQSILGEADVLPRRPRTAQPTVSRSSLREMRGLAGRQQGFDRLTLGEAEPRRPATTTGVEHSRTRADEEFSSAGIKCIRPLTPNSGGSRPSTARPPTGSTGATGNTTSRPPTASSATSADSALTAETLNNGDRGSAVIVALRAALEEERLTLLAQTEQLHLSLEDEVEFRERSVVPPPSLTELQALKKALNESIAQQEHARNSPALRAPTPRERRALSSFTPMADAGLQSPPALNSVGCGGHLGARSHTSSGRSSQRLRSMVADASELAAAEQPISPNGGIPSL